MVHRQGRDAGVALPALAFVEDVSARVPVRGTPAADDVRVRRPTIGSRSLPAAIAVAQTSSSVMTAGRPKRVLPTWQVLCPLLPRGFFAPRTRSAARRIEAELGGQRCS